MSGAVGDPKRGDCFTGKAAVHIKRVIGLPGETRFSAGLADEGVTLKKDEYFADNRITAGILSSEKRKKIYLRKWFRCLAMDFSKIDSGPCSCMAKSGFQRPVSKRMMQEILIKS